MIFLEYFSKGESHSDGNASTLALLLNKYSSETFHLFLSKGHYECIKKIFEEAGISLDRTVFHEIQTYPKTPEYKRFLLDFKLVKNVFDFAKKYNETKIYSTYTTTVFLVYLKMFLLLNPSIEAITAIHSELERLLILKFSRSFTGTKRLLVVLYSFFFGLYLPLSINLKNYKCLVYGESIKNNLLKKVPLINKNSVIAIDHPYIIDKSYSCSNDLSSKTEINFGVIGLIGDKKNGVNLKKLLDILNEKRLENFKISLIGHIMDKQTKDYLINELKYDFVESSSEDNEFIPREKRDFLEKTVDYNIYTYNSDGYKLTASGAFLDSIKFEKPTLVIKNDFFNYYFNKFGNIGYLFDSAEDMAEKIVEIIEHTSRFINEYSIQKQNIREVKKYIDIDYIACNTEFFTENKGNKNG